MYYKVTILKIFIIGSLLSFIFFSIGCGDLNVKSGKTDLEKSGLKGDVILVVQGDYSQLQSYDEYNERGMLKRVYISMKDGKFYIIKNFEYIDDKLNVVNIKSGYLNAINNQKNEVLRYYYDSEGNITKTEETGYPKMITIYKYEENKLVEEKCLEDGKLWTTTKYSYINGELESKLIDYYIDQEIIQSHKFGFKNGTEVLLEVSALNSWKKFYEYDESNLVKKITHKEGKKTTISLVDYSFDPKGNWIEKSTTTNGKTEIETRKIYYKGEDISFYFQKINQVKSTNSSNNNSDQSTTNTSSSNTNTYLNQNQQTDTQKSECYQCKGSGQCRECSKTFRREYYKGNGYYDKRNETKPGYIMCNDCFGRGHKQVKRYEGGWEPGGDCYVSGCMDGWIFCRTCNSYGNGRNIGQCDRCKGTGFSN